MPSADSFDHVVIDLHRAYPAIPRGTIQRILIEEHDLLVGLEPGDIVPTALRAAADERLARIVDSGAQGLTERA